MVVPDAMEDWFVFIYRGIALLIIVVWGWRLIATLRQPPTWEPPQRDGFPVRITRKLWLVAGVLGVLAGVAVFAFSFVLFPK